MANRTSIATSSMGLGSTSSNAFRSSGRQRTSVSFQASSFNPDKSSRKSTSVATNSGSASLSRFVKGTKVPKPPNTDGRGVLAMLRHPLCILLVGLPLGACSKYLEWGNFWVFWFNFVALIPLAKLLGDSTEELAAGLKDDILAGLLNATFGNAVEVVFMVQTLRAGLIDVVKATLLGSVLSNLLLVLGSAFFFGGMLNTSIVKGDDEDENEPTDRYSAISATEIAAEKVQTFATMSAMVNTSMLLLACLSLSLVTVFEFDNENEEGDQLSNVKLPVSRVCSIIIMIAYFAYIFFQLVTHREVISEDPNAVGGAAEEEEPIVSVRTALGIMLTTTLIVAISSDMLVNCLEDVTREMHVSSHFVGIILIPIFGNACEHVSAIRFAIQDKPGLAISIAVGSSTQISLFVVPFAVIMGWIIDQPMDLDFGSLNTTVVDISVVVVLSVVVDGNANWLQGWLLVSAYFVIAVLYWHLPDKGAPL